MSLVNLGLQGFLNKEQSHGEDRFVLFAAFLNRRLNKVAVALEEADLFFEAGEAQSIAKDFGKFCRSPGDADDFAMLWNCLEDWAGSTVEYKGRTRELCSLSRLPDRFSC